MRDVVRDVARRALTALLAVASLLAPVAPLGAQQISEWTRGVTCGMECCKRAGRCCCHKPAQAAPVSQSSISARECPAGCGSSARLAPSSSNFFGPVTLSFAVFAAPSSPCPQAGAGVAESSWLAPSLWQRPPPAV